MELLKLTSLILFFLVCAFAPSQSFGFGRKLVRSHGLSDCRHDVASIYDVMTCSADPQPQPQPGDGVAWRSSYDLIIAILVPTVMFILVIACFLYHKLRSRDDTNTHNIEEAPISMTSSPEYHTIIAGLDLITIESYSKVVIGGNDSLPRPDESTCPICLSEFEPDGTLKILPHCMHSFHARCIDEWLLQSVTCPVCRSVVKKLK